MPDDVRTALEAHPAVQRRSDRSPDPRLGETPVALVELRADTTAGADELIEHLRKQLARYENPSEIVIVDSMPRTPSGKPDLTAVRGYFAPV